MDKTERLEASEHGHEQVAKQALDAWLAGGAVERALKALDMAEKIHSLAQAQRFCDLTMAEGGTIECVTESIA
jgi:hypothetical protein